jgi:hypothetical protein
MKVITIEKNEQFKRFMEIIIDPDYSALTPKISCSDCPLYSECSKEEVVNNFKYDCFEALWHYIQTGKFIL